MEAPRRVLVTGADGFVGAALLTAAAGRGWAVRAASRRCLGGGLTGVEPVSGVDLSAGADWRGLVRGVEAVVHCAARVHVMHESAADPLAAFRTVNVDGTLALARQAAAAGVRRFVFVSTIGVNGAETFRRPFRADDTPAPPTPYARSKHEAEIGLQQLARQTGLELVIVRPPLIHGPGAPGNFGRLLRVVQRGLPLPLATVDNRRSLVGVANLSNLLATCIDHPRAVGQTLLVADGEDLSTPELVRRIARALRTRARLFPFPVRALRSLAAALGRESAAQQLCGSLQVDDSATRARLGWTPITRLDAELDRAARHLLASCALGNLVR